MIIIHQKHKGIESMKTINAERVKEHCLSTIIAPEIIFIIGIVVGWLRGFKGNSIALIICVILYNLLFLFRGISLYRQYSIMYGNGKVVIKHGLVRGESSKFKQDEFLIEEIESYSVVYYHNYARLGSIVAYFQLKDKERTGYVFGYYPREQLNEFFQYIYEETSIEVQVSDPE